MKRKNKEPGLITFFIAIIGGLLVFFLIKIKLIKVIGYQKEKFIPSPQGLLVIYRHPSPLETVILPLLSFTLFIFSPQNIPYSAPAEIYYERFWFMFFRRACVPVRKRQPITTLRRMQNVLDSSKALFIAPEGMRTRGGKEFKLIWNGQMKIVQGEVVDWQNNTRIIKRFERGVGLLVQKNPQTPILPIWVEGGEKVYPYNKISYSSLPNPFAIRKMKIIIGEQQLLCGNSCQEIIEKLENMMLSLGEER